MLRNAFFILVLTALSATASWSATGAAPSRAAAPKSRHAAASRSSRVAGARSLHATSATHPGHHRPSVAAAHTRSTSRTARRVSYSIPSRYRYAGLHRSPHPTSAVAKPHRFRYRASYTPHSYPRRFEPIPAAIPAPAPTPAALSIRTRRFTPMPPPLRGSLASLERQNEITEAEGLDRIADENDLVDHIEQHQLVPLPASASLMVNTSLVPAHRYCRPWTARFLSDFARAHEAQFGRPLLVSSAVRTVEYQKRLMAINGNAAAAEGDIVSPHLTGATIDIAKGTMSRQEIGWVRAWLLPLQAAGKLDVEEEFQQACFHITVYKTYAPAPPPAQRVRRPTGAEFASRGR